jgi:tRNA(fMet)-specific endonuclease VapC
MYVFDTDLLLLLEWPEGEAARRLQNRLNQVPSDIEVVTTVINYEEQTRGWFALLAKAKTVAAEIDVYRRINRHLNNYRRTKTLDFDERAAIEFQRLKAMRLKVGRMDLKISAIVISNSATLLTRNVADFRGVPGLKFEDWTR